jgi:type IX secretion system PorP/SprF family membrane protein
MAPGKFFPANLNNSDHINMNKTCCSLLAAGILFFLGCTSSILAQDLHYSQIYMNPQHQNPALAGIFEGNSRFSAQHRSQWETVPVQYRTLAAGFDTKLYSPEHNMLAAGLLLQRDQAGDGGLTWTQIGLNINAAHAISPKQIISLGLGLAFVQRDVNLTKLKFNNQWDGDIYNPSLPSKETLNSTSGLKASLLAGLNWHFQQSHSSRTVADIGISSAHVNRPNISFQKDGVHQLPVRYSTYGQAYFQSGIMIDYMAFAHFQYMQKAMTTLIGAGMRYWLSEESAIQLACATRLGDAIIPSLTIQRKQWTVGLSYDVNISGFKVATGRKGGFEIAATYTAAPVKPIKEMKVCPVF